MLTISRSILRRFRTLCRRGGLYKAGSTGCIVTFVGGPEGCRIQAVSADIAIEYHQPAPCEARTIRLPLVALEACQGRDESPVTITIRPDDSVELAWNDHGVPRSSEQIQPKPKGDAFPVWPDTMLPNDAELWPPLADAVETTDPNSSRYALGCLQLRGAAGTVEATDGHQALTQGGYRFGFEDDALVPATKLLGCTDLNAPDGFRVGRSEKHVGFELGSWRLTLRIQDGRFPKLDQILPSGVGVKSTLEFAPDDARLLTEALPRLPCHDGVHMPVTLDLNGKVLVRCRETETARPTELQLGASQLVGEPIVLNTNRRYVERALRLGFRNVGLFGPESPALCVDDRRRFIWMLLDKGSAIPRHEDPIRMTPDVARRPSNHAKHAESDRGSALPRTSKPQPAEVVVTVPIDKKVAASATAVTPNDAKPEKPAHKSTAESAIEQALTLRDTLRTAAQQAGELARSLKQQKRQARIVATTLASLKELQKVAG
ncbi:MAG: hypothetical protein K8U03_00190 [Planctomycetia bacterium]|nr:hypothetical protein [Planctomycetia bacterium]